MPAALANSIGSQAQKPLAIVVVGGMLVTLFLTRYLMPVLYSFFPAPAGHGECQADLILGSHYTDRFLQPSAATKHAVEEATTTTTMAAGMPTMTIHSGHQRFRRASVMKINWKLIAGRRADRRRRDRGGAQQWTRAQVVGGLEADCPSGVPRRREPRRQGLDPGRPRPKGPWDRTLTLDAG